MRIADNGVMGPTIEIRDRDAIGMNTAPRSDWIPHLADKAVVQRGNGYCSPSRSIGLDANTTERVKTSATRSWDEAVELGERDELGRYIEARLCRRHLHTTLHVRKGHNSQRLVPHTTDWAEALTQLPLR
jgi:hypothetical protein